VSCTGALLLALPGCGAGEHYSPIGGPPPDHSDSGSSSTPPTPPPVADAGARCKDGEIKDCHVTLTEHEGIIQCFVGLQVCEGGEWSHCKAKRAVLPPGDAGEE
jgi:hypothetical protein